MTKAACIESATNSPSQLGILCMWGFCFRCRVWVISLCAMGMNSQDERTRTKCLVWEEEENQRKHDLKMPYLTACSEYFNRALTLTEFNWAFHLVIGAFWVSSKSALNVKSKWIEWVCVSDLKQNGKEGRGQVKSSQVGLMYFMWNWWFYLTPQIEVISSNTFLNTVDLLFELISFHSACVNSQPILKLILILFIHLQHSESLSHTIFGWISFEHPHQSSLVPKESTLHRKSDMPT